MTKARPSYAGLPNTCNYGRDITPNVQLPFSRARNTEVALMDLGFSTQCTHGHANGQAPMQTLLEPNRRTLTVTGPPTRPVLYPPGPAWVHVLADGVPPMAEKVLIGNGGSPPVDQDAIDNMLANTGRP
ncbi:unnamed protein product [Rhizoctonia solani]|uniref:Galactose oxidase-like Early set domain-containing protein n=1 Tax=Rhizoctonia solani TaxID=456999 RepID=A0A8H3CFX3_9AGAM|nr:unnamed protein product [Rhizoctonia solani]